MYTADAPGRPLVEEQFFDYRAGRRHPDRVSRARRRSAPLSVERRVDRREDQRAARPRAVQTPGFLSARLLLSCGEASGDLYAGALTRELLALDPDAAHRRPRRAAVRRRRRPPGRRLSRALGHRPDRVDRQAAAIARGAAPARRGRAAERPDALVLIDFSGLQLPAGAARSSGSACRSSTTSARRSGRGAPGRLEDHPRDRRSRAGDLSVRGGDLSRGRRAGGVRRPSADRSGDAVGHARRVSRRRSG